MRLRAIFLMTILLMCSDCTKKSPMYVLPPGDNSLYSAPGPDEPVDQDPQGPVAAPELPVGHAQETPAPTPAPTPPTEIYVGSALGMAAPPAAAPQSGLSDCPIVEDDASPADCAEFERQYKRLLPGLLVFNPPKTMILNEPEDIELSVGKATDAAAVRESIGSQGGATFEVAMKVGKYMTARLDGSAFEIKLVDGKPAERTLGADRRQVWKWSVKPIREGKQKLTLQVSVDAVGSNGERTAFSLEPRNYEVLVDISTGEKAKRAEAARLAKIQSQTAGMKERTNWLIALAALITAAGGVWFAIRTFGKAKQAKEAGK